MGEQEFAVLISAKLVSKLPTVALLPTAKCKSVSVVGISGEQSWTNFKFMNCLM